MAASSSRRTGRGPRGRKRRRWWTAMATFLVVFVAYHRGTQTREIFLTTTNTRTSEIDEVPSTTTTNSSNSNFPGGKRGEGGLPHRIELLDASGNPVTRYRHRTGFSDYLPATEDHHHPNDDEHHDDEHEAAARARRSRVLGILEDAGLPPPLDGSELGRIPTDASLDALWGPAPVVVGLDTCDAFRKEWPDPSQRFLGIAGAFNSGTTAFARTLAANCYLEGHHDHNDRSNELVQDTFGILSQVPWAKHKTARERWNHTIHGGIPKKAVLPIVLVRDPWFWMQSMCQQGYGVRWDHDPSQHCPNLVPDHFDRQRFKRLKDADSVRVWMGKGPKKGPSWPSLVHYWNDWQNSYLRTEEGFPRLMIRFEDTLFHPRRVVEEVCRCGGGVLREPHRYLVDEAKWDHRQRNGPHAQQNNLVSAMVRYGTAAGRLRNTTAADREFAEEHLDRGLLETFRYRAT